MAPDTVKIVMTKREYVQSVLSQSVGKLLLMAGVEARNIPPSERAKIEKRLGQLSHAVASQFKHLPRIDS